MQCAFCKDPVPQYDQPYHAHVCIAKTQDGHIHTHGDLQKRELVTELLDDARGCLGLPVSTKPTLDRTEVVFHNRQRIGDILMMTCGVRDFHAAFPNVRVNVVSTCSHIWDHNPAIDRTLEPTEANTVKIGPGWLTNASNRLDWHFANAYRLSIEQTLGVTIPQGLSRPDLWLTEEEYHAPRITPDPYWLIVVGGEKGWGCKMYPIDPWQWVVDHNPDLLFYQLGAAGDHPPRLTGKNVVDYVGKTEDKDTGIRDLFRLFLNAEGSLGLVSFHMHLSGALYKPSVVVAGAREPVSFTRYPGHQYLANDGTLPCAVTACWHCDIKACTNLVTPTGAPIVRAKEDAVPEGARPKCVDMIAPEEVSAALRKYYTGGRLTLGQVSAKPKLKNIVPTPPQVAVPVAVSEAKLPSALQQRVTKQYGAVWQFGGGAISEKDWQFLESVLTTYQIKTVLEFGAGVSTLLFAERVPITTYETMTHWRDRIKQAEPLMDIHLWDGKTATIDHQFDLAFVDGPSGGKNRQDAVRLAAAHARIVVVHDGQYPPEKQWQAQYLEGRFHGPLKGGDRCYLWLRADVSVAMTTPAPVVAPSQTQQHIKIVSTARGWGGCARSITTIMKLLLQAGHQVEFIPFRHTVGSREFQECLSNGLASVKVTPSFETLRDPCDTLLVYADDYVWEFGKPDLADAFRGLRARKKVMMLNYRRGKVGEIPWTQGWDRYCFLNSGQQRELLGVLPGVPTTVLPPCTDLTPFLAVQPTYEDPLQVVRHSSQGDTKFAKDCGQEIAAALATRPDATLQMLPGPSFVEATERFIKHHRTADPQQIAQFLASGNLFWYSLPHGYLDMGPRVILEAMAAGLPILADPWGGAVDRVTPECGWLRSKTEQLEIIQRVTTEELRAKGQAAKARAQQEFVPEKWLEVLVG